MYDRESIEFPSEEEAKEYFGAGNYSGYYTPYSYIGYNNSNLQCKPNHNLDDLIDEPKVWVVCANVAGSYLYATNGRPSYYIELAKRMTYTDASKKAVNMTKKGTYHWECQRVK